MLNSLHRPPSYSKSEGLVRDYFDKGHRCDFKKHSIYRSCIQQTYIPQLRCGPDSASWLSKQILTLIHVLFKIILDVSW